MRFEKGDTVKIIEIESMDSEDTNLVIGNTGKVIDIEGGIVSVLFKDIELYNETTNYNSIDGTYDMYEEQLEKCNKVEIITNESCDYTIVKLNDKVFSAGHSDIPVCIYNLLRELSVDVIGTEISDKEMEELYG